MRGRAWCPDPPWQGIKYIARDTNCQGKFRGQFVYPTNFSDSTSYHCLDRSDESVLSDTPEELDLPVLETCTDFNGGPGLRCHDIRGEYTGGGGGYSDTIEV